MISRLLGSGDEGEARKVSAFSFWFGAALSLAYSLGLGLFMDPALHLLGASENIYPYARQYAFCVIVLKVERLPLNTGIGICQGMVPLVAYNCASGDHRRMNGFIRLSLATGLVVAAVSIALYELFTPWIVRAFIADPETVALASIFLRIRILATPLMFLSFFTVYLFQGFGIGRVAMVLAILRWAVFNIPMLVLLNALVGMYGILWTPAIGDGITVLLSLAAYLRWRPRARTETPQ